MQSLTLAIWGTCRTLDGPGFEPLISKASECDSIEGKGTPEGIFRLDLKMTQSRESRARVFRRWWATWPESCGAVRARLFRRQPRANEAARAAADRWDSATVVPYPPITVPQLLLCARVGDSVVVGPSRQQQRNLPHWMRRIRAMAANPSVLMDKNREGGLFGLTWPFCLRLPCLFRLPCILSP